MTPFNPRGFLMKPCRADCEALLTSIPSVVIADKVDAAADPQPDTWDYLHRHNIKSAIIEFWDDASLAATVKEAKKLLASLSSINQCVD